MVDMQRIVVAFPICGHQSTHNCWHPDTEEVTTEEMTAEEAEDLLVEHLDSLDTQANGTRGELKRLREGIDNG